MIAPINPEDLRLEARAKDSGFGAPASGSAWLRDLASLAATACGTPIACVSLFEGDQLRTVACVGLGADVPLGSCPRCCVQLQGREFVPFNARSVAGEGSDALDPQGSLESGFHLSVPVVGKGGQILGSICAIDTEHRLSSSRQRDCLMGVAGQVAAGIDLRARLQESAAQAEFLSILTGSAQTGLVIVSKDRRYAYANQTYARILGIPLSAILGQPVAKVLGDLYETCVRHRLDAAFGGIKVQFEAGRLGPDPTRTHAVTYEPQFVNGTVEHVVTVVTDITAQKLAQVETERRRREVQELLDTVPAIVFYKDRESRFVRVNRALAELVGRKADDFVGRTDADMGAQDGDRFRRDDLHVLQTGEPIRQREEPIDTGSGVRWLLTDKLPYRDASGEIMGVVGLAVDITDRKRAKDALHESVRFAQATIDALSAHVCVVDEAGCILATNASWRLFGEQNGGGSHGAGPGTNYLECCERAEGAEAREAAEFADGLRAVLRGDRPHIAVEYRCDGPEGERWFVGRATRFPGDGPVRGVVSHENITDQKKAENELRKSQEEYRLLFTANPHPMWVYEVATLRFLAVNDAAVQHYGYTREEFLRMTLKDIRPASDVPALMATFYPGAPDAQHHTGLRHRTKEGRLLVVDIKSQSLSFRGVPARLVLAVDTTERTELEARLRQSQKMEAIGQLAGGVAHDFNNILTAIQMQAHLARTTPCMPPESLSLLNEVDGAIARASNLTRQLLAFSRRQVLQRRVVDLNEVVASFGQLLQRTVGADVRLTIQLHPQRLATLADPGLLDQVLLNLVVNARDAMPKGGILLIQTMPVPVDGPTAGQLGELSPGRYVGLRVKDTGTGIAREHLPRLFEPFFTTKAPGQGTGLGLATVFGIVRQHGGSVFVESEPGDGTEFQVVLPASEEPITTASPFRPVEAPRGGSETVLLVEDDAAVRSVTRRILARGGYAVIEASHGVEALAAWNRHPGRIHLLLTDLVMPEGLHGRDLAAQLIERDPKLRVVFTSGYSAEMAGRELSLGAGQDFIQKPATANQILETVRRCLDGATSD